MSTILMSACWPLQGMSPAQKAVLISLADQANDDGYCWPSVGTIAKRTCLSERAVQGAIKWLQAAGLLVASERRGTSSVYQITTAAYAPPQEMRPAGNAPTPADAAPPPPQMLHPTPADAAPKPSMNRQLNRKEPLVERACARAATDPPDDVDTQIWADWLAVRRAKRAGPVTPTVLAGMRREAAKAGIGLQEAIAHCCVAGWQGFRADWYLRDRQPAMRAAPIETYGEREEARKRRLYEEMAGRRPAATVIDVGAVDAIDAVLAVPMIGREGGSR